MSKTLRQSVKERVEAYLHTLDGAKPVDLYDLFCREFEAGLIEAVLSHTKHNKTAAAAYLGMARGTLIKKAKTISSDLG